MSDFDPRMDEAFRKYAELQLFRHRLLVGKKANQPETDEIEDELTELWGSLDETQRRSLNGMSSDLNWVRRGGELPPRGRRAEEITEEDRQRLNTAINLDEWHEVLHYLRVCAAILPRDTLALRRGQAYEAIHLPGYARVFFDQSVGFAPVNGSVKATPGLAVSGLDPDRIIRRAETVLEDPKQFPARAVALSTAVMLWRQKSAGLEIDRNRFTNILEEALARVPQENPGAAGRAKAYQYAAAGFEILDQPQKALLALDEGLKANPNDEDLLFGRGLLLYGTNLQEAEESFNRVSEVGTLKVWPSIFLANQGRDAEDRGTLVNSPGSDLIMQLTKEQGEGRETQVQPPLGVWYLYFGIQEQDLPRTLSLMNKLADTPVEDRPVVLHHHNMTIEIVGATPPRPAIIRFRRTGGNAYDYWVYHEGVHEEYGHCKWVLENTPNPHRRHGRLWLIV
jgi:tetratricopeptide (TPR) repeat protein